ncbi:hypothetical protein [Eleftheria terrae]|uniref:hypothetical protein n=1 Tax=Eleftheria terrae TaxID=1597781 RepID=UPI00263BB39A|nr:hypothetical protein [Eleftheria terrae]WKB50831.1 hypothetical protein N7L95_13500 [Eleftheria terrae]
MTYILQTVEEAGKERITADAGADPKKLRRLQARGGFFENTFDLTWAVDREINSYLVRAPKVAPGPQECAYFFLFEGHLYGLWRPTSSREMPVNFDKGDEPDPSIWNAVTSALTDAFSVYGRYGSVNDPMHVPPIFPKKNG